MTRYKMAIRWANGDILGYTGEGGNEDDARDQALKMVFSDSAEKGIGFIIIPPADVPYLSERCRDRLYYAWEMQSRVLDRY